MRGRIGWVMCLCGIGVAAVAAAADDKPAEGGNPAAEARPAAGQEVVVTATRTAVGASEVPASVTVLDRADIESRTPVSADELLKGQPGIELQGSGYPGSMVRLNMRGLTTGYQTERVLVLMDGRRLNEQYQGNAELALFPADGLDRVEVVRGPGSALYGSGAMGGVVNLITRRGTDEPETWLRAAGGAHNLQNYQFSQGGREGPLDYFVAGSRVSTDGYTHNSDGTPRDWRADNLMGNAGWDLGQGQELRLSAGYYDGAGTDENSDRQAIKNYLYGQYALPWGGSTDCVFTARAYRNGERNVYDWKFPGRGVYDQDTLAAELQQTFRLGDIQEWTAGVEARREAVDVREVSGPIDQASAIFGAYAQDRVRVADPLSLTAGARWDYDRDFGGEASPRAGLVWQALADTELYASANRAYRAPSLSDRFVRVEFNGSQFVGNPDLKPETLMAYEAGARHRWGRRAEAEVTGFYNDMDDSFDFVLDPDGVFRNRNVTRSRTYGAECSLRYRLTATLAGTASYTWTEGTYEDFPAMPGVEGNRLAYLAKHKASAGLEYRCPLGGTHRLDFRYTGDRYGDAQNTADNYMPDFVVVDWRTRLPVGGPLVLTLNVDNLFDRGYRELPATPMPGRTVIAGAEVTF